MVGAVSSTVYFGSDNPQRSTTAETAAPVSKTSGSNRVLSRGEDKSLSEAEQREIQRLREMDRRVRQHEQAHLAAGGAYVRGGAQFTYVRGPDGKMYATGGEVSIDVSPARTPEATIAKMQQVRRAALAPADPSPQDRSVAAAAARAEMDARRKLAEEALEEQRARAERRGNIESEAQKGLPDEAFKSLFGTGGSDGRPPTML